MGALLCSGPPVLTVAVKLFAVIVFRAGLGLNLSDILYVGGKELCVCVRETEREW